MLRRMRAAPTALCAAACALVLACHARAGVVLSNTRVVFPGDAREVTVRLTNTRTAPVLVEAWIERDAGAVGDAVPFDTVPFHIVPPLFRIEPGHGRALRVYRAAGGVPADRESLFWLNVFESPAIPDASANAMHIAVRTRVKVFLRPPGLAGSASRAPDALRWRFVRRQGAEAALRIENPTAFHVTIARAWSQGATALRGDMVAPFGRIELPVDARWRGARTVEFEFINDFGGAERRRVPIAREDGA